MSTPDITLTEQELVALTGYAQAAKQLDFLHARGFYRAVILPRTGRVSLAREHFAAVEQGRPEPARPKVIPPRLRERV